MQTVTGEFYMHTLFLYMNLVYKNHHAQIWCKTLAKTEKNVTFKKENFMNWNKILWEKF